MHNNVPTDLYQAMAKEWYWFVIVGLLVAMSFCPAFLKGKCPRCKKFGIKTVDGDPPVRVELQEKEERAFLTFFRCTACGARLMRELTGPYEDAAGSQWTPAFERGTPKLTV